LNGCGDERSRFEAIVAELRAEFPRFRLIPKDESRRMRVFYRAAAMRFWNPRFLEDYTTVVGSRVYMPRTLIGTAQGARVLRHERVHLRDAKMVSWPIFAVTYLFLLPAGLTFRALWEWRAYLETLRAELDDTGQISDETLEHITRRFAGPDYLFMCPFPRFVRRRLEHARARIMANQNGSPA
jgi:hypothetical protein